MSIPDFYLAFEERFYGSRDVIKRLRRQYLPFIQPLATLYPGGEAFDIGCGRGEWLEFMRELGFNSSGLDLDEGMLRGCLDRGLSAKQGDAVAYLKTLASESQAVVTAFHVVEHITFEQLQTVVVESLRVLKPGGLLIMETPNPENIAVGTCNFYLDPTHRRPLPPLLLSFLPEFHGYARISTLRLQENRELRDSTDPGLNDVLAGASPDYAVVAQKTGAAEILVRFDAVFDAKYGIHFSELARRYDSKMERQFKKLDELLSKLEVEKADLDRRLAGIEASAEAELLRAQLEGMQVERNALLQSWSWRITRPLRWLFDFTIASFNFISDLIRSMVGKVLLHPQLSAALNKIIRRIPWLHQRLRVMAIREGYMSDLVGNETASQDIYAYTEQEGLSHLSPLAREIYSELTEKNQKR